MFITDISCIAAVVEVTEVFRKRDTKIYQGLKSRRHYSSITRLENLTRDKTSGMWLWLIMRGCSKFLFKLQFPRSVQTKVQVDFMSSFQKTAKTVACTLPHVRESSRKLSMRNVLQAKALRNGRLVHSSIRSSAITFEINNLFYFTLDEM